MHDGAVLGVTAAIRDCAEVAIAAALAQRNTTTCAAVRLPDDLLLASWTHIGMTDRIVASAVCRRWRDVALDSAALWADVQATSFLHGSCECTSCREGPRRPHNLHDVEIALRRGKDVPITLTITVTAVEGDPFIEELQRMLQPSIDRFAALHVRDMDGDALCTFLTGFTTLPALHSITYERTSGTSERITTGYALEGAINLPALVHVELDYPVQPLPHRLAGEVSFPSVRVLQCPFEDAARMHGALEAFPHLDHLHVRLPPRLFDINAVLKISDTIADIRISAVQQYHEVWIISYFTTGYRMRLHLHYADRPSRGFEILENLSPAVHLACTVDSAVSGGREITVMARDDAVGRQRSLSFSAAHHSALAELWTSCPASSVTTLDVDSVLWTALLPALDSDNAIARLTVRIRDPADFTATAGATPHFPRLEYLCLQSVWGPARLALTSVLAFVEALGVRGPLERLHLDSVVLERPSAALVRSITNSSGTYSGPVVQYLCDDD